ncbi:hypothetical protein Plhal304r1_c008g0032351 [Plasmopara halstedii]
MLSFTPCVPPLQLFRIRGSNIKVSFRVDKQTLGGMPILAVYQVPFGKDWTYLYLVDLKVNRSSKAYIGKRNSIWGVKC